MLYGNLKKIRLLAKPHKIMIIIIMIVWQCKLVTNNKERTTIPLESLTHTYTSQLRHHVTHIGPINAAEWRQITSRRDVYAPREVCWRCIISYTYRVSQKEVPPTFEKSLPKTQTCYSSNIYMARKRIMFLVYCEKMRLFENPNFKIWTI